MMSKRMYMILTVTLLIGTVAVAASLERGASPTDLLRTDCQIGNLNDPVGEPVPNIFMGNETYAYHVYPIEQCSCAEDGFSMEMVNQMIHFTENQVPVTLVVQGFLLEAVWEPDTQSWLPGPPLEESIRSTYTIDEPGTFVFSAQFETSNSYLLDAHYFLGMQFDGDATGQLVIDNEPMPGVEFVNDGTGWQDMYYFGKSGDGKIIAWGDVICSVPVDAQGTAWGAIKALYR